jgi:YHS domain-containing protein
MYRLLIILGLLVVLYFLLRSIIRAQLGGGKEQDQLPSSKKDLVQDPVCRMYVSKDSAVAASIGGQSYFFCSKECAQTFQKQLAS